MPSQRATDIGLVITAKDRARFESYFTKTTTGECWLWRGKVGRTGYARILIGDSLRAVHRVAYLLYVGAINDAALTVDHTCRVRACVNPSHLRLLTQPENARLAVHPLAQFCRNGHEYTPTNTRWSRGEYNPEKPRRTCRACKRENMRRRRARGVPTHLTELAKHRKVG